MTRESYPLLSHSFYFSVFASTENGGREGKDGQPSVFHSVLRFSSVSLRWRVSGGYVCIKK